MRMLCFVLFALASPFLWNCAEKDKAPVVDQSKPEVLIFYPNAPDSSTFIVRDSIETYFAARDVGPDGQSTPPSKVELWFSWPGSADRVFIGTETQPISMEQVPANIAPFVKVPSGWSLYTRRWYTGPKPLPPVGTPINSGTHVQLFAYAYDAAGNIGRTPDVLPLLVYNNGDNIGPPIPRFTVSPPSGTTEDTFTFSADSTTDRIDPVHEIRVRWDFDGNGVWDVDWDRDARADMPQTWKYVVAKSYTAKLEAHNSYLPDSITWTTRSLVVTPRGGNPHPPEPLNYVDVPGDRLDPACVYVLGDSSYTLDGRSYPADADERPIHRARITTPYKIERTEVSNRLYLNYLRAALDSAVVEYRDGRVYSRDPKHPDLPQELLFVLKDSQIFFVPDDQSFATLPAMEEHPVTGVTWTGAGAYAIFYGLRLPSEAEWEIAARGNNEELNYPFAGGVELTRAEGPHRVNYAGSRSGSDPFVDTGTTPVGFYNGSAYQGFQTIDTPSIFGAYDMAGNVREWVSDWYGEYIPGDDPQGQPFGTLRVIRGGSYESSRADVRCTARAALPPDASSPNVGFRTAYIVPVLSR
jgi:formylglycine-generating enzyme required for sulfatase activity